MINEFLKEYKTLEENTRYLFNKSVYEYEAGLDPDVLEKLKVCRLLRNYVIHQENDEFVSVTTKQVEFIRGINNELERLYKRVGDKITELPAIDEEYTVQDVAKKLMSYEFVPVVSADNKVVGVFNKELLMQYVSEGAKHTDTISIYMNDEKLLKSKGGYYFAKETDRLSMYHPKNKIIVVNDNDEYLGIIEM